MLLSKAIYIAFNEHILSIHAFPENWTHDLGIPNAMLYCLSYRITIHNKLDTDNPIAFTQSISVLKMNQLISISSSEMGIK